MDTVPFWGGKEFTIGSYTTEVSTGVPGADGGSTDHRNTSIAFGLRCKQAGVRPSTGSVGDCYDNALCESFVASLECELLERHRFQRQTEAGLAIVDFIEGWYDPHRQHSALDYLSPMSYERNHQSAA